MCVWKQQGCEMVEHMQLIWNESQLSTLLGHLEHSVKQLQTNVVRI